MIVDAIMDVKNPKLCAVYMDGAVNSDNRGICIIKTDYASMERRLRKDFEKIYSDFAESRKTTELLVGDELKELRFIGETNIKSLVKLAMINDNKQYGMMLIASNEENFFEKGISYYETCLVEYNVSVKSTKLYLQTQDMARKDGLTQIYNRVYFGQLFAAAAAPTPARRRCARRSSTATTPPPRSVSGPA